jgi:hypothetical protein
VYYPVALAEKIAGQELNPSTDPDIVATFNSNGNWYFGTNGTVPLSKMDLVTVVLHEICHGLGFVDTYTSTSGQGAVGLSNIPFIYDLSVVNSSKQSLFSGFASPSTAMNGQLVSNNLFYNSALAAPSGVLPKVYAPTTFDAGSSIAHLDESSFTIPGDANNLMTPQIAQQESIHQPGSITLGMLNDMGWISTRINHTALKDTERKDGGGYPVKTTIVSDNGFKNNTVTLNYRSSPSVAYTLLQMTPTGVTNEFQAVLPGSTVNISYAYFITVEDNLSRIFRNPGLVHTQNQVATQNFNVVNVAPDNSAPVIEHTPADFILNTETQILVEASVTDNVSVSSVTLQYSYSTISTTGNVPMTKGTGTDVYSAVIPVPSSLNVGDLIKYKIIASDESANSNQSVAPSTGLYTVFVTGDLPAQNSYVNDFDTETFDFIGNSFSVQIPTGFTNGAIHSAHPYENGSDENNESNYTFQLQVPIIISQSNHYIQFDEIVLVEPGETGSKFGEDDFFDYVVVEASKDDGLTWTPLGDGYDARANSAWLTRYNSNIVSDNSMATGIPSLYRERMIDILATPGFAAGHEIKIRFRLFADQAAHGWGWAIDNISIQGPVTSLEYIPKETMELFPNPVVDILNVGAIAKNSDIEILSADGRKMFSAQADENHFQLNISDFPSGIYILKVADGKNVTMRKFVKSN